MEKNDNKWMDSLPDDGRDFIIYGRNKGDLEYYAMDIVKPAFVADKADATCLKKEDLATIIPAMKEKWTEVDWKVKDAGGVEYIDSLRTGMDDGRAQDAAEQQPAAYRWPEGGRFVEVDEKAMMAAMKMGIDVSPRDFAVGVPPTSRRIAVGLAGAVIDPQADRESFGRVIRDNRYPFDSKTADALWGIREQYYAGELSLNQIVNAIEGFVEGPGRVQDTSETLSERAAAESEAVTGDGEEKSPFQQIRDAVDAVRKEEGWSGDITRLAARLTDDQLAAAIGYAQRYKGRKKAVRAGLEHISRQVQGVIDERYNARHPAEAEEQAYAKTIEYLKQGKDMEGFSIDEYIRNHERERDEARGRGLDGQAAVQRGVVRAAGDTRRAWNAGRQDGGLGQAADAKKGPLADLIGYLEKGPGNEQGTNGLEPLVKALDDVSLELAVKYAENAGDELGRNPEWYSRVMDTLHGERDGRARGRTADGDRISFFRMNNGHHGINETINGVRSATRRVSEEDVEWYFKDLKGSGPEEVNRRRAFLADKYLHAGNREQKQDAGKTEGKGSPEGKYMLPPVSAEVRSRLAESSVYRMRDGVNFAVRCKIDGEQQGAKVLREKDVAAFFDNYKGQTHEFQQERKDQVAALYFREELNAPKEEQERSPGMHR